MSEVTIVHLSDLHFGWPVDLAQIAAIEALVPELAPNAVAISGDLTQRARHGEFQRGLVFVEAMRQHTPTLIVPGNHDVQWWQSPFGVRGTRRKFTKYRHYFGEELTPTLTLPGVVLAGALTAHGFAWGSVTWNPNDSTVKGHLPRRETDRLARVFAEAPPDSARVAVLHHNVLRGDLSQRMGLAHWRRAQRRLVASGADVVLCGHDHQEGAGQVDGKLAVSTAGTHSSRSRGHRASAFNVVKVDEQAVHIQHWRWDAAGGEFRASDTHAFACSRRRDAVAGAGTRS